MRHVLGKSLLSTIERYLLTVGVLALMAAVAAPASAQNAPPPPVSVAKPIIKEVVEFDEFIGRFEAVDQVDIRSRVTGYVEKVHFTDGATVKAGDLLLTIDQRPYQASLDEARASIESAKARVAFATGDFDRAQNLTKTGFITGQVFDERAQSLATAKADLSRAEASEHRATLDLQFTEIRAPISGRMSRRLVSVGNLIVANDTILTNIVSMDPINFYFDVDERAYLAYEKQTTGALKVSQEGNLNEVQVATANERAPSHKGYLDFTENRLDTESGTMRARGTFENKDLSLKPGMFGRITISGSDKYNGILVPEEAIGTDQDSRVVYVVGEGNVVGIRRVRVGPGQDGYRIIREGLKGDETIVVNGLMRVRPGVTIDPKMTTLPPIAVKN